MSAFGIQAGVREDGSWFMDVLVPNGATVTHADAARLLSLGLEVFTRNPGARCLTMSEIEAMRAERALPKGWAATSDGVSTNVVDGDASFSRTYAYTDADGKGLNVVAPCSQRGEPLPETRAALLAALAPPTPEA